MNNNAPHCIVCNGGRYMRKFNVYYNQDIAGYAEVVQDGLYYSIRCYCKLKQNSIFKILACAGTYKVNLGVCVPANGGYVLLKRIPAKYLPIDQLTFVLQNTRPDNETSVTLLDELIANFPIAKLKDMCLICQGDRIGVVCLKQRR